MPKKNLACIMIIFVIAVSLGGCTGSSPSPKVAVTIQPTPVPTAIIVSPTAPPIMSLSTGTMITWKLHGGYGQLVIDNHVRGQDAVVIMAGADDPATALMAVYVKGGQDYTVDGITDGQYVLYDMIGSGWDAASKRFINTSEYARFSDTLNYTSSTTEYKVYTVTLSRSFEGDMRSEQAGASDIPAL